MDPTAGSPVARRLFRWLPVAAWAGLIFGLSSESEPPDPAGLAGLPGGSQAAHLGLYFVLGALLYWAVQGQGARGTGQGTTTDSPSPRPVPRAPCPPSARPALTAYWLAFAAGALYAATDEVHQYFVPHRQADAADWLVDIAGVLAGALVLLLWERSRGKL